MKLKLLYIVLSALALGGCTKGFNDIENPNNTTIVPPSTLFTGISRSTFASVGEAAQQASQFYVHLNGGALNEITYEFGRNAMSEYNILRNVEKLKFEAERQNAPSYYLGLVKFFRAYLFVQATQKVGDIPYSEALKAEEGLLTPKYDKQRDIYIGVLQELEEANDLIPATGTITGDIIFDGSLLKWKKLVNTFRLRVLMSLSLKTGDTELGVINQFKKIYDDPAKYPIMTSNADNCEFKYYNATGAYHYWYTSTDVKNYRLCTTLGDVLKTNLDPRLFKYFEVPASPAGLSPTVHANYKSIDHGVATSVSSPQELLTSKINSRYINQPIGVSYMQLGYNELQFILAEASFRGWISGNTETFYQEGIRASCQYHGVTPTEINTFLAGPVKYDESIGLKQINTQRWVAYFQSSNYEPLWNQRRTRVKGFDNTSTSSEAGYPVFKIGNVNKSDGKVPNRFQYYLQEAYYNERNLTEAIQRQFGEDNINGVMWSLIKQ
jgi:hypothetical protein